jgi:hypothetical protein
MLIGMYDIDIYAEATLSPDRRLTVDFLGGCVLGAKVSSSIGEAVEKFRDALPAFCEKNGCSSSDFRSLKAEYSSDRFGRRVVVFVEDKQGRLSTDEYVGTPARRIRVQDSHGRVRPI